MLERETVLVIKNVQGLRFFAAAWVAVFHLNLLFGLGTQLPWVAGVVGAGYAGVDIFFVISGYIMALTTAGRSPGLKSGALFLTQRFARIYCGWWPFFLIYLCYAVANGGPEPEKRLVSSFFLWPTLLPHHLLPIAWTLSFELLFYAFTAAVLVWSRCNAWIAMLTWAAVVVLLNSLWITHGRYQPEQLAEVTINQWFLFYPLTLEFIAGFVLHDVLRRRESGPWIPWVMGAILFALLIVGYQHFGVFNPSGLAGLFHAPERAVLWGGLSVCLVAAAVRLESRGITPFQWAVPFGDASYSIYLGHILLIQLFLIVYSRFDRWAVPKSLVFVVVLVVLIAVLRSYYQWVERPLYGAVKKWIASLYGGRRPDRIPS